MGKEVDEETINSFLNTLNNGGKAAVDAMKEIRGEDLTSDEIKAAYTAQLT